MSNDDEVQAIINAAYQRVAVFESDCSNADQCDIEKYLAEVYAASNNTANKKSSRDTPPPPKHHPHSSSYPPGSDKVHVDWSEHYDRQESLDEIIDVDRFASRHSILRSNKNTTTIGAAGRAYLDAEYYQQKLSATADRPVNSDRADNTTDYNENSDCDPIIYLSKHSLLSISTLGTEGFKSSAKKTVDPFTTSMQERELEHHTDQHSRVLEDHAISNESSAIKPPTPPFPARPLKRQMITPPERNQRLSSSSVKHPGEGRPAVTNKELAWQDRTAFEHYLNVFKAPPSKPPLTRRASAPIEWQQRVSSTRTKLSTIPQSPYVVEGATPSNDNSPRVISPKPPGPPPFSSSSPPAAQKMDDIDIRLTAKSSGKTRVHTGHISPLPINVQQQATTGTSRAVSLENKHSSSVTNLRKVAVRRNTVNGNLSKSWHVGGRSHEQHQLMKDHDEINLSRVALRQDTIDENYFGKSWPADGRLPTGGRSQQQYRQQKGDDLLKKVKVGYQNDREKECLPPPPSPFPRHYSPHSVTCVITSPVVSPTDSEEAALLLAPTQKRVEQQSKNAKHLSRDDGLKNIGQDRMKMHPLPLSSIARLMQQDTTTKQISSSTMQSQTQRDFNIILMKLQHQVELSKRTNKLAVRQYHARHFWFFSIPISTFIIMSIFLVMACAINGLDTDVRIGFAIGSVFCSIMAIVFYYLAEKFGLNHHAALHKTAMNDLTKAGFRLDQLTKYKGCGLLKGLHSTKACTSAIRTLHRLDMYIQAMNQFTPEIPQGIERVYQLLLTRINRICRACPNTIEKRLSYIMDDDNCDSADHATTTPIDLKIDAYNCLQEELRRFVLYPVFMPNADDVVSRTIDIFFEDTTESDSSMELNTLM